MAVEEPGAKTKTTADIFSISEDSLPLAFLIFWIIQSFSRVCCDMKEERIRCPCKIKSEKKNWLNKLLL